MTDGLLLLLPLNPGAYLETLHAQKFPYVVIDNQGFDDFSPTVVGMNWQGAYDATHYLIKLGHRRIGFIAGRPGLISAVERLSGYKAALQTHGIEFDPRLVATGNFNQPEGYIAAEVLLNLPELPTAIFAGNDLSALGVLDAVRNRGLTVPDDISVMGFDDIQQAAYMRPGLTTVRQPLAEMGQIAVRMLLEYIEKPDLPTQRIEVETELMIRETCCPPNTY
jgi:LacI family transcriptional regulator